MKSNLNLSPYDSNRNLFLLFLLFVAVWLYMLGARTLVPTDEGRYAEMAREMAATGDWITLRLNGIKYFEKPPLQNWMNALSFELFGLGDWQARLWTGLCGLLGIAASAYAAFKMAGRRVAIHTAIILGSSFYWAGFGHINSLDMGLSAMMCLALCGLLIAQTENASASQQRNGMLLCWAGMALATLSKGLIGVVLPGAVLVIYTLWTQQWQLWKRLHLVKGLLLFFAITVPWFILVWQKNPEHPQFFFIHEHFQRFTSTVHKRGGAWYYFIVFLVLGIFPWLTLMGQSVWQGLKAHQSGFQSKKMLLIWVGFIFLFFSVSGSKLPSYILPIFPALAILIALQLDQVSLRSLKISAATMGLIGALGLLFLPRVTSLAKSAFETRLYEAAIPWAMCAALLTMLGALMALIFLRKNRDYAFLSLAISAFLAGQAVFLGHDAWGRYNAGIDYVPQIKALLKPDTPIYAVGQYEQALPFYLQRTTILVEHADELEFGLEQQPELWIPHREQFIKQWQEAVAEHKMAIAIFRPSVYEEMLKLGLPMKVIANDPKRVIVSSH